MNSKAGQLTSPYCKKYCNMPNAHHKKTKVATKLMKIVLCCTKFKLNEAIDNNKAKVDTNLIEKLNLALANAKAKLDAKLH
jgi:hypothetical protein